MSDKLLPRLLFTIAMVLATAHCCHGQTTSDLLVQPWFGDELELSGGVSVFPAARWQGVSSSVQMTELVSDFRMRLGEEDRDRGAVLGYSWNFLSLGGNQNQVPRQLTDLSAGGGLTGNIAETWFAGFSAAAGYAGDAPFGHGRSFYGRASALLGKQIDSDTDLLFLAEFDGNRGILPDVPLPGIEYRRKFSEKLNVVVGYPTTSITWKPVTPMEVDIEWYVPDSLGISGEYTVAANWSAYGQFSATDYPYHVASLPGDHRLFYLETRFEAGIRWKPSDSFNLSLGVGYAIDRRFYQGFDERNLTRVQALPSQPFLGLECSVSF